MLINFVKLSPLAVTPARVHEHDAGNDLVSIETNTLNPGQRRLFKTGLAVQIPAGFYGRIAPRSGLALKKGLDVMAGVIDSDFRGEIGVVLINLGQDPVWIEQGDKIAQLIIERCEAAEWIEVNSLDETSRGTGGYGSSGT